MRQMLAVRLRMSGCALNPSLLRLTSHLQRSRAQWSLSDTVEQGRLVGGRVDVGERNVPSGADLQSPNISPGRVGNCRCALQLIRQIGVGGRLVTENYVRRDSRDTRDAHLRT